MQSLDKTKRAVIYCRVSTKEQVEEGNSLSTQEKICKDYALKNGYEIVQVFIEQGESAKTIYRTELKKLLAFCADRKNSINAVIAYKIDRISRNTDDYSQIRLLLKQHKVEIRSTSENFEDTPVGKFLENTMANIAQFDNDIRTERSVNGMKDAVRDGRYVWKAPFGYVNIKVEGKATIGIDPVKGPILKKAFEDIASNLAPIEMIRRSMIPKGLTISKPQFYRLLKNELYCGWIKKFGEKHRGLFTSLIDDTTFNHVQHVVKGRKKKFFKYMIKHPDFPLRRFIYKKDGTKLTGSWSKGKYNRYAYYRFMSSPIYFTKDVLESHFKKILNLYKVPNEHMPVFLSKLKEQLTNQTNDKTKDKTRIQETLIQLQQKQSFLLKKNMDGIISDQVLKEQLEEIENEISSNRYHLLESTILQGNNINELLEVAEMFLKNPAEIWESAPYTTKMILQEFVFPSGICLEDKILRTPEICSIFKAKEAILPSKSHVVPLKFSKSDGRKKYHKRQITYYYIRPPNTPKTHTREGFLQILCRDLSLLQKTISGTG